MVDFVKRVDTTAIVEGNSGGIFVKTLNQLIGDYTRRLQQGEIQAAYKGILEFMGKLRADFIKKYPGYDTGSVYQGYMDMSYFSITTTRLKEKGLKIAIVYLHEKGDFEAWLSARNREIAKRYESLYRNISDRIPIFHDDHNQDAIIECTLMAAPDFEDPASLMSLIELRTEAFVNTIAGLL